MIEVRNLTKNYGRKTAVNDISFTVSDGKILGFLGPNGAGKSTTMNIITGYLSSSEGTVSVDGLEILENPREVKSRIGYLPEQPPLYLDMTVREYLSFIYDLKRLRLDKKAHLEEICGLVRIEDHYGRRIRNLSKGYRQRVGLAQALLGNPGVLILDEPTVGLDPRQIIEIRGLIQSLGKGHTVILSSHILSEVQAVCDRVIVISQGVLVADDTPGNLTRDLTAHHRLRARVAGPQDQVARLLEQLPGVADVQSLGAREQDALDFLIAAADGADPRRDLFRALAGKDWPLLRLEEAEASLEEVFLQLISAGEPEAEVEPKSDGEPARSGTGETIDGGDA